MAAAGRIAAAHPAAKLPCPVCVAEPRGEHLDRHLAKLHAAAARSHIMLPREPLVGVEYALAARGDLRPRAA